MLGDNTKDSQSETPLTAPTSDAIPSPKNVNGSNLEKPDKLKKKELLEKLEKPEKSEKLDKLNKSETPETPETPENNSAKKPLSPNKPQLKSTTTNTTNGTSGINGNSKSNGVSKPNLNRKPSPINSKPTPTPRRLSTTSLKMSPTRSFRRDITPPNITTTSRRNSITPPKSTTISRRNSITPPKITTTSRRNSITPPTSQPNSKSPTTKTSPASTNNNSRVSPPPVQRRGSKSSTKPTQQPISRRNSRVTPPPRLSRVPSSSSRVIPSPRRQSPPSPPKNHRVSPPLKISRPTTPSVTSIRSSSKLVSKSSPVSNSKTQQIKTVSKPIPKLSKPTTTPQTKPVSKPISKPISKLPTKPVPKPPIKSQSTAKSNPNSKIQSKSSPKKNEITGFDRLNHVQNSISNPFDEDDEATNQLDNTLLPNKIIKNQPIAHSANIPRIKNTYTKNNTTANNNKNNTKNNTKNNINRKFDSYAHEEETIGLLSNAVEDSSRGRGRSLMVHHTPQRSRSIMSLEIIGRWTREISAKFPRWYVSPKNIEGTPNEIQYSVFKPSPYIKPIKHLPPEGFENNGPIKKIDFTQIVENSIEAIEKLGYEPKRISAGSSGSYFIYNTDHKIVGVFKPKDEEPYGPLSPKWTKWIHRNLFPCFFGRSCLIPNLGYICEASASLLDRQLQSFIVPYTDTVFMSSDCFYYPYFTKRKHLKNNNALPKKVGSFQLFLNGYLEADQFFKKYPLPGTERGGWGILPFAPSVTEVSPVTAASTTANSLEILDSNASVIDESHDDQLISNLTDNFTLYSDDLDQDPEFQWSPEVLQQFVEELEKLVILDYIMRNTDRGLDNWMIKAEWETVIDNSPIDTTSEVNEENIVRYKKVPRLRIGAIDSGLAFPWKHPDEWRSYPFGWLFLPISIIGRPFSERSRQHYLRLLTSTAWWEETALLFRQMFARDSDFKERMWKKQWAVIKGQAFNVVETLKCPEQGPLELARRTRVMIWDDEMDVPVHVPINIVSGNSEYGSTDASADSNNPAINSLKDNIRYQNSPVHQAMMQKSSDIETIPEGDAASIVDISNKSKPIKENPFDDKNALKSSVKKETSKPAVQNNKQNIKTKSSDNTKLLSKNRQTRSKPVQNRYPNTTNNRITRKSRTGPYTLNKKKQPNKKNIKENQKINENEIGLSFAQDNPATKRVIIERLETVTSKPPVFTWC
ncbi:1-phosphatidylinositol 4-kinase LSB6 ASCRUDRAFT_77197 [Ascoidea rubescens DSM 1968]|uniref:1-phosphatidylinositol 4-kinase n=1 Tax=Ascoidea rubescens DSM 1968 TaxID=1344418 RepID=A0A1D2VDD0_9ASCO|nr:hypothetical protein ASCRUDRAFT_77197 [Ascoidea rubescens DSM 1968]ODV59467.1 hypothetical protein ASCRUDRAFT_77197 [Ascoidea rubescens DSM 1968]